MSKFMEDKYVLRARNSPLGCLIPEGKQQAQVCEKLVQLGRFVRLVDGAYSTPEIAEELGLALDAHKDTDFPARVPGNLPDIHRNQP
jgi:hypothetical protein